MNLVELKSKIILKQLPNLLVFTGPETGVMKIYINTIVEKFKYPLNNANSVQDVVNLCSGNSFFKKNKVFLVTDDNDFLKTEKAWTNIKNILKDNLLILKYHNYDARLSFWKNFEANTVIFEPMNASVLANHLSKETGVDPEDCLTVANSCNSDYIRCQLELDKVVTFAKANNIPLNRAFKSCYNTVLCLDMDKDVFDFVNAVLTRNYKKILILYRNLKMANEPVVKVVSLLYNSFKNILIAQTIANAKNIQQNTGLNYYGYQKAKEFSGYYTNTELEDILYTLMNLEQGIKTGFIDSDIALDYFFLRIV